MGSVPRARCTYYTLAATNKPHLTRYTCILIHEAAIPALPHTNLHLTRPPRTWRATSRERLTIRPHIFRASSHRW